MSARPPTPPLGGPPYELSSEDKAFLRAYRPGDWPRAAVTVDLAIFTVIDSDLKLLLIERGQPPFRGRLGLPGGFVRIGTTRTDQGESLHDAAERELAEETGLPPGTGRLIQVGAFGDPGRDPRMRVITVAWCALIPPHLAAIVRAGDDAAAAGWHSLAELAVEDLAFDHPTIVASALRTLRGRITEPEFASALVAPTFTIPELRAVYEAVLGSEHDAANFRRRFRRLIEDGVVEQAPGQRATLRRPAAVYRFVEDLRR